ATLSDGEFLIGKAGTPLRHAKGDLEAESVTLNEEQLDLPLPRHLPWPSQQVFEANTDWLTVYSLDGAPAVVWRKNGAGEVMALADGYHLLNEALKQDPQTHLLSWLLGANRRVAFHEHHLG